MNYWELLTLIPALRCNVSIRIVDNGADILKVRFFSHASVESMANWIRLADVGALRLVRLFLQL